MVNHVLFIPPSFRSHIVSMPCWHSKCQSFQRWHIKQTTFWGNHSPCYTTHLCQPILNQRNKDTPQNFTSLGIRLDKTFISHIPLLNFAGAALHVTPRICANPSWTYRPKIHHKTSDRKIFISHICFELCRNSSPCYTTHVSQPILNQRPKTHYKLQIRKCSSHTSVFWTFPEQMTPRMCANPEPMFQRYTTKPQTPRFSSHTSLFWTLPEQLSILHHACEPTRPEPTSQATLQTSDPKIFISHIRVLNFAGTTRNRWHLACVPTLNQCCKDTPQNLRP